MTISQQTITLDSLRFYAYHGAEPQEAIVGAWYTVSVSMKADATAAILNDDLNGTVNYAKVTDVVKLQMQIRSALLEHVAGRIANSILDSFPTVQSVTVTVSKVNPPVGTPCTAASFTFAVTR
jgi:dihydroneopterin aldolase